MKLVFLFISEKLRHGGQTDWILYNCGFLGQVGKCFYGEAAIKVLKKVNFFIVKTGFHENMKGSDQIKTPRSLQAFGKSPKNSN